MQPSPHCQELLQALERVTSRLSVLNPEDLEQVERALVERRLAIEAIVGWLAVELQTLRPDSPHLADQLTKHLQRADDVLVRLNLTRAGTLQDLQAVNREIQLLHALSGPPAEPSVIDCQA